ncbi:MAG: periplasmic heavy metal sensor [Sphingomonadales bacterium]|nr:MAG: periplasmic heavy metal sensor [Sphingomonadales bacterium]
MAMMFRTTLLAASLLFAATAAAHAQLAPPDLGGPPPGEPLFLQNMSTEGREIMSAAWKAGKNPEAAQATRQVQQQIIDLIAAPHFDENALKQALERERKLSLQLQQQRHWALVSAVSRLTDEDRRAFASSLEALRDRAQRRFSRGQPQGLQNYRSVRGGDGQ